MTIQFGSAEQVAPVFIVVWIVLGLFSAGFFLLNKNAQLKRKVLPPFVVGTGILFAGFMLATGAPWEVMLIFGPAIALITFLNLRSITFCNSCGATLMNQNPFSKPAFCSKCGASLKP